MQPDEPSGAPPEEGESPEPAPRRRVAPWLKALAAAAAALLVLAGVLAYRSHQERRIVALSIARARQLLRADAWLGYHEAAALLGVRAARLDPVQAGSLRALALAMLALDYRDAAAADEAAALLVAPTRAAQVPVEAELATAALALRDGAAGDATSALARAGDAPPARVLAARVALLAGNAPLAAEEVGKALAADEGLPAGLALRGDLLRRGGKPVEARVSYGAALAASERALAAGFSGQARPEGADAPHARATLGLGKLALSRELAPSDAAGPLARLAGDRGGTPQVERARAAMHLAAIRARGGDRAGAGEAIAAAGLEGALRGWLEKAAAEEEVERGPYRALESPRPLQSASDDDPYVPPPPPPPPRPQAAAAKPALHGFKVHPLGPKEKRAKAQRAKSASSKKAAAGRGAGARKQAPAR